MWETWLVQFDGVVTRDIDIDEDIARQQEDGWVRLVETDDLVIDRWGLEPPDRDYTEFWIAHKKEN